MNDHRADGLETRLARLEDSLHKLEINTLERLARIEAGMSIGRWIVPLLLSTMIGVGGLAVAIWAAR